MVKNSQLDRIEYLLERRKLKSSLITPSMIFLLLQYGFYFIVLAILMQQFYDSYGLINALDSLQFLAKNCLIAAFVADIIIIFMNYYRSRKLKKRFNIK